MSLLGKGYATFVDWDSGTRELGMAECKDMKQEKEYLEQGKEGE